MSLSLSGIRYRIKKLAQTIGASNDLLPTFGRSEQSGRPHIEVDGNRYHFVIAERGEESRRHTTPDIDDLLYDTFRSVTFEMACKYEVSQRIHGQDPRRILFEYQEELLSQLFPRWGERRAREHAEILEKYPFDHDYDLRSAYAQELKEHGFPPETRWKMVLNRYPPSKEG